MREFYIKNKKILNIVLVLILSIGFFSIANVAWAGPIDKAVTFVVGWIALALANLCGVILGMVTQSIINITQYNKFITEPSIVEAWIIVRDICNMFFVLILLVIAFATILRVESYNVKKLLPKLLIMAVLINFSRIICGLLIDFSQVIMLTFVNAFADGGGNFYNALKVKDYLEVAKDSSKWVDKGNDLNLTNTVTAIIVAVILMLITTITMIALLVVFLMRVVMLWIYIILSPLAFLLSAFPGGQKYASQFWGDFTKYLINGPVLAFFIWLALITANKMNPADISFLDKDSATLTSIMGGNQFMPYLIFIGLLVGGLMISSQIGGIGANWGANTVKGLGSKAGGLAKKGAIGIGKTAAYIPAQYAKRAAYGVGDSTLNVLKDVPLIGNMAVKGQAKLRMLRDFDEEKETRYMKYVEEPDLDRLTNSYTGDGRNRAGRFISGMSRGMESSRQDYKRAMVEKGKRGDEWGMEKGLYDANGNYMPNSKMANKTRWMIRMAQLAGHSVTASGEDTFRDDELGKQWAKYRNDNAGMIDDDEMRAYYLGGQARPGGTNYQGLAGGNNSEYFRGGGGSPNSMIAYTGSRHRMGQSFDLHHENLSPRMDAAGVEHYDYFDALYNEGLGPRKTFAQMRDRGTIRVKDEYLGWMGNRLDRELAGQTTSTEFATQFRAFTPIHMATNPGATPAQVRTAFLNASMVNGGNSVVADPIGRSRNVTGKTNPIISSGITGLDKIDKGRLALNFSEIGLDNLDGLYADGSDKTKLAARIGQLIGQTDQVLAKSIEEKINSMNYLILHNKEKAMTGQERRGTHAHETLHGRIANTLSDDDINTAWDSMGEPEKEVARKKVKGVYKNDNMSEEAIKHEYLTEGLTSETRWAEKDPAKKITLGGKVKESLNNILKSKGSNLQAFTSNIVAAKPNRDDVKQTISGAVSGDLKETIEELTNAISGMGDGLSTLNNVTQSIDSLEKTVYLNKIILEKNSKKYEEVVQKLSELSR